jgi:uncharacterized protein (TIGR00369 family)
MYSSSAVALDIPAEVRSIIADVTRYPIDILEPTADIEEDLGIDSVKLGEVLSVLRERYGLPPTAELRARFPATQLRTIGGIAEAVVIFTGNTSTSAAPASAPAPVTTAAPAPPVVAPQTQSASLLDEVRQIFAELTRYPIDILSSDADLEDDLGIDSVKLGEIFSVLRERYALPPRTELRDRITPTQLRTIGGITEIVAAFGNGVSDAAPPLAQPLARTAEPAPPPVVAPAAPLASKATQARSRTISWSDPMAGAAAARSMAGIDYLRAIMRGDYPVPPMASLMDFTVIDVEPGRVVVEVRPGEQHYNPIGVVHAGMAATVLDTAMACAVHSTLGPGTGYATIEFKINLVRAVTADVGRLRAVAEVVHGGSRIATAEARLLDDAGALYAHATETCMLMPKGPRA